MCRFTLLGSLVFVLTATPVNAENAPAIANWPQWRGPKRDDLSTDTRLLQQWPRGGPRLMWESHGAGRGYASVAIAGGRIYTMGDNLSTASDEDEYLACFDEATGKQLWKSKLGSAWNTGKDNWQGSRSTPTVAGDLLYVLTPYGNLVCLETATGKQRWRKSLKDEFKGKKGDGWGYSESVLVDGDRVVCTPGGGTATMVTLNKKTGQVIWKAAEPNDRGAGHASIVVADIDETRVYVQTTASGAIGVRASDGTVLWTYPIEKTTAVIPTPIVEGDLVFFSAGYNRGGALLRQVPTSNGGMKITEVYPLKKELNNKHGGIVHVGKYLYGDTNDGGTPFCAEFMTGNVHWKKRGSGTGSAAMTYADGHLYVRYANGTMVLVEASPADYREVGSFKIPHSGDRPSWSHPVVSGGKLFLREGDYLLCYDLRSN
jgi:outer membrane protein assembly factor BamB